MKRLIVLLLSLALLPSCAVLQQVFQPPQVTFSKAEFKALDFDRLAVDLLFDVTNNNPLGGQLAGYSLKLAVDGVTIVDGDFDQAVDLRPGARTQLVLPAVLPWRELAERIARGEQPPAKLPYTASGSFKVDSVLGRIEVPLSVSGKVPVVLPPLMVPSGARIVSANPLGVELEIDLQVRNPSGHDLKVVSFDHTLSLAGHEVFRGSVPDQLPVKARRTATRQVRLSLSTLEAGAALISAITGGGQVDVRLRGDAKIDTGFGRLPLRFDTHDGLNIAH